MALLAALLLWGCGSAPEEKGVAAPAAPDKLSFKDPSDRLLWKLKIKEPGAKYKLYQGDAEEAVATLKVSSDRVKVKDASDAEILKVKRKEDGVEVEDGAGKRLYRIKVQEDGDLKVEDAAGALVVQVKRKDDGVEVRDPQGATVAKVKAREGKVVFQSESGSDLFTLKGESDPLAGCWMAVESLSPQVRAALVVYYREVR